MAHNLFFNETTRQYGFVSVQKPAPHGLGRVVRGCPTSAETRRFAGLDYEVQKRSNLHRLDNGTVIASFNSFYTYRPDTEAILGDKLGADYQVLQNAEAFSFFDSIVGGDGIQYETAGALGKGERIFISARLPSYVKAGNEDLLKNYLFLTLSHNGLGSIVAGFTSIRIVCADTLAAALRSSTNLIRISHTPGAKQRLDQAQKRMGILSRLAAFQLA